MDLKLNYNPSQIESQTQLHAEGDYWCFAILGLK